MKPALCIVVPVLDEAETLAPRLLALQQFRQRGARVVVVDGGSQDDTLAIARAHADLALLAPPRPGGADERRRRGLPGRRDAVPARRHRSAATTPTYWCAAPCSGHPPGAGSTCASTARARPCDWSRAR